MEHNEKSIYQFAYSSLQAGRYLQAVDAFRMLTCLQPMSALYWFGLSEASFKAKEPFQGENAYKIGCTLLDRLHESEPVKKDLKKISIAINEQFRVNV